MSYVENQINNVLKKFKLRLTRKGLFFIRKTIPISLYKKLYGKDSTKNKRFYNLGAGDFEHEAWTNIDYYSKHYKNNKIGINWDATKRKPLPIKNNSAEVFYSSHLIEHIRDEDVKFMLKECYRSLKPGGVIRITCPNIMLAVNAYVKKDKYYFLLGQKYTKGFDDYSLEQRFMSHLASQLSRMNYRGCNSLSDNVIKNIFVNNSVEESLRLIFDKTSFDIQRKFPQDHINFWTVSKLYTFLFDAGFGDISISSYAQSKSVVMRDTTYFDNTHPEDSLYLEAKKIKLEE